MVTYEWFRGEVLSSFETFAALYGHGTTVKPMHRSKDDTDFLLLSNESFDKEEKRPSVSINRLYDQIVTEELTKNEIREKIRLSAKRTILNLKNLFCSALINTKEQLLSRVCLVPTRKTTEDRKILNREHLDFLATYRIILTENRSEDNLPTMGISQEMIDNLGVTEEELWTAAKENTVTYQQYEFSRTSDVILEELDDIGFTDEIKHMIREMINLSAEHNDTMYVLRGSIECFGSSALIVPSVFMKFATKRGCDLLICPQSVHELMVIPLDSGRKISDLITSMQSSMKSAVSDVPLPKNMELNNTVYRYHLDTNTITIESPATNINP